MIISNIDNNIIGINEYSSSKSMQLFLNALLLENKKVQKKYHKDIENIELYCEDQKKLKTSYFKYVIENLIEYELINLFTDSTILKEENTQILEKNALPQSIVDNIFIKVLSKDYKKRKYFYCEKVESNNEIELYSLFTAEGYIYEKLKIKIPKNTKIFKEKDQGLIVTCKYFTVRIEWGLEYGSSVCDHEFYNYFLQDNQIRWLEDKQFSYYIDISVQYKIPILFSKDAINYCQWIEELMNSMTDYFDYKECKRKNDWKLLKNIKKQ